MILNRKSLLTRTLFSQKFQVVKVKSSFHKFHVRIVGSRRSNLVFGEDRVAHFLVFYRMFCVLLVVWLSFLVKAMTLSVYFILVSRN